MQINFDINKLNANFFLHAWYNRYNESTSYADTWMKLVTVKNQDKYKVFDLVDCKVLKGDKKPRCLFNTFLSYGEGKSFEEAKEKAAIYFIERHKDFEYLREFKTIKKIIPNVITLYNAYSIIMKLANKNFFVPPTFHFFKNIEGNLVGGSMHIKSLGYSEIFTDGMYRDQLRDKLSYLYICNFLITDGYKYIDNMDYEVELPDKYPYNENARIFGYFDYNKEDDILRYHDERENKENKPRIDNTFNNINLESCSCMEEIMINKCITYKQKKIVDLDERKLYWEEHKQYFEPMDKITEFGLEEDFPMVSLTDDFSIEEIKEMSESSGMSVKDLEEDNKFCILKERAKAREKIIKSGKNPYYKWYEEECLNKDIKID